MSYSDDLLLAIKSGHVVEVNEDCIGCHEDSDCDTCPFSIGCDSLPNTSQSWLQFLQQFLIDNPQFAV